MFEIKENQGPLDNVELRPLVKEVEGGVTIAPDQKQGKLLVKLRSGDENAHAALMPVFGKALPLHHAISTEVGTVMAMGPQEWMLFAPESDFRETEHRLRSALEGQSAAVVDMTAGLVALHVFGPLARGLLQAGCPVDLSNRAFQAGHVARTLYGRYSVTVMRCEGEDGFIVFVARSFARSFCASLTQ